MTTLVRILLSACFAFAIATQTEVRNGSFRASVCSWPVPKLRRCFKWTASERDLLRQACPREVVLYSM